VTNYGDSSRNSNSNNNEAVDANKVSISETSTDKVIDTVSTLLNDVPAIEMANTTSVGTGEDHDREGRKDYTGKSDPIRKHVVFGV